MADAPRDPRQLARDILSGKISIEDLAREQRRRQEAAGGQAGGGAAKVPAKFPLPRQAPARPVQRTAPPVQRPPAGRTLGEGLSRPPQRTVATPVRRPAGPVMTPGGAGGGVRPAAKEVPGMTVPAAAALSTSAAKQSSVYQQGDAPRGLKVGAEGKPRGVAGQATVLSMMRDRGALRRAMVMAEILGKPLSLRDE